MPDKSGNYNFRIAMPDKSGNYYNFRIAMPDKSPVCLRLRLLQF
jgi:hypothetical protein